MVNPVPGHTMTTPYRRTGPHWKACGWHTGADWAAPEGTPVVAAIPGDLRRRDYGSGFGTQVAISPDPGDPFADGEVFYAHLSWLDESLIGKRVKPGQVIGRVGSTGNVTGPHLHFERHTAKQQWSCQVMADPMNAANWQPPNQWVMPAGTVMYLSYVRVDGHDDNADGWSASIKCAQDMLNKVAAKHGRDDLVVPVTGKYWTMTDRLVRWHQETFIPPPDADMKSFVGPRQAAMLVEQTGAPYTVEDDRDSPPDRKPWLCKAGVTLREQIDALYPGRDTRTDGWVGDQAHCGPGKPPSEHCPDPDSDPPDVVRALDIDADLTGDRAESQRLADLIVAAGKNGDPRLWYVIHNGKIRSVTYGWENRDYDGSNPHESHIHVSFKPAGDQDDALFDLDPDPQPQPVTRAEFDALEADVAQLAARFNAHRHPSSPPA